MEDFKLRRVHLDFHTAPMIPGVGSRFNKEEWQEALKLGHVDSITVFSKCHHGYSFHPTEVNEIHPSLKFDLLGAQLEACREIGVEAPVYISAGLDEKYALTHPEWLQREKNDRNCCEDFFTARFHMLCLNTGYLDELLKQIEEVMQRYNPEGLFFDILDERVCYCAKCRADMAAQGLDFLNDDDARLFAKQVYRNYLDAVERTVRKYNSKTTIFHNSGHVHVGRRDLIDRDTHLELESLPTGGWGYDHFPMSASYARSLGFDFLGMTGKFHKSWGEFGGFKHPNALRYEAALTVAMGGGCSVGDQMHPEGKLNRSTFSLIGRAYAEVEEKEPWLKGAKNIVDIAVLGCEGMFGNRDSASDCGVNRLLLETHRLYNFIDKDEDFGKYKLLILPDEIRLGGELKAKLEAYLANGGKLLLSGVSGLDENGNFAVDTGVEFVGENSFNPNYFIPDFETVNGVTEYIMREKFYMFNNKDAQIVAYGQNPYFNRTPAHYCSHMHAPNDRSNTYPTAAVKGNVAYIGWEVFKGYALYGDLHRKELVSNVIDRLLGDGASIKASLPDRGVVTLTQQGQRKIAHLLFAHTTIRGRDTEVIEDIVPIFDVDVSVKADKPSKVMLVPQCEEIDFSCENGRVSFTVPRVEVHQMISIE